MSNDESRQALGTQVPFSASRLAALGRSLPGHTNALQQRRSGDIPLCDLNDYMTLGWMRWAAGRVVITYSGMAARRLALGMDADDD